MVAQNLTKKPSKSDDEISVESFSEATQEKRLEEVKASVASSAAASGSNLTTNTTSVTSPPSSASTEKRKVKYKERKIITPSMPIAPAASIVAAQQKQKQFKNNGNSNR